MSSLESNLLTALLLGLVGSTHCLGMCGGIAASLGIKSHQSKPWAMQFQLLSYNLGRLCSYALIGALLALITTLLQAQLGFLSVIFRSIAGLMLIAMGLYLSGWWLGLTKLEHYGQKLWQPIQQVSQPLLQSSRSFRPLLLGLTWGLLPCGLIYSTLIWCSSIASNSAESALLMFTFGLGTLPAMLLVGHVGQSAKHVLQHPSVRGVLGVIVILMGVWTLIIPFQHLSHGSQHNTGSETQSHHHHH
jgi:sulfite exporter TauE/SafE